MSELPPQPEQAPRHHHYYRYDISDWWCQHGDTHGCGHTTYRPPIDPETCQRPGFGFSKI